MDYWRVNITNAISPLSDQTVIHNANAYKSNFMLNGNNILAMYIPLQNIGETLKSGVDLEAQWRIPTDWGRLSVMAQGTYMLNSKQKKSNEIKYNSDLGRYNEETLTIIPRFKSRVMTSLSSEDWTGSLVMNYVSGYTDKDITALNLTTMKDEKVIGRRVSSYLTWDVISTYAINKKMDVRVAIFNLMNQQAPLSFSQTSFQVFGANTVNSQLWGRTLQLGATLRF